MSDTHFYEPHLGHGLRHEPIKAILAPRVIGWISTVDGSGRVNLAPYSFFAPLASNPPIVGFTSEGPKDSYRNCKETGEFVWNLATMPLAQAMNMSSVNAPHGVDEMAFAGLEAAPSRMVRPPRVAASPAAIECKVTSITELTDAEGRPLNRYFVIGVGIGVHIDPAYLRDGIFDTAAARPIARCGYRGDYAQVDELFQMIRPDDWSEIVKKAG